MRELNIEEVVKVSGGDLSDCIDDDLVNDMLDELMIKSVKRTLLEILDKYKK